jgi:tetratricopeptide (TPR) repeat protein
MKGFRHISRLLLAVTLVAWSFLSSGCAIINKVIAKDKLNQGALSFNRGSYQEAYEFIKSATELDPSNPNGWLFYGATLIKIYSNEGDDAKKKDLQNQAINAYQQALKQSDTLKLEKDRCSVRDNAIGYLAKIYDDKGDATARREWLLKRTDGECAKPDVKAATFYSIGVTFWKCAYDETQRYADKQKITTDPFHFRTIYTPEDKKKHEDCVGKGMEYLEKALAVNPDYADALSYKSLLLREKQKTTNVEADRKKYNDEAEKLAKRVMQLNKEAAAKAQQG